MATTTMSMFLYSLTLQPPSAVTTAILGQFMGTKEQQIISAAGSRLTLYRPDAHHGKIAPVLTHDVFSIIRSLASFRITGSTKDYIIIGSDSGRITVIEYLPEENRFEKIHMETFGKSGVRRVVPGQYLAADPKGRACMIASLEKNKLVYVLNRNAQAELTISSPLEAHRPQTMVPALVALDVGFENPIFATLEVEYGEYDQDPSPEAFKNLDMQLVFYELDLGINHVVRKWTDIVDRTANMLLQVPGGTDGPSGVLVCCEDNIIYRHTNQDPHRIPIPRRKGALEDPEKRRRIVAGTLHKMKGLYFYLVQTEDGDLFKLSIDMVEDEDGRPTGEVGRMRIKYFGSIGPATCLLILKSGFLYAASVSGDQHFYQFTGLGDEDQEIEFSSEDVSTDMSQPVGPVYFNAHNVGNLLSMDTISCMNPLTACKVANLTDGDAPQVYTVSGTGAQSSFRTLKHGLEAFELVESAIPNIPSKIWTVKQNKSDDIDKYIVLSFSNASLVLAISEDGKDIEEAENTGFITYTPTLAVQLLGEDSLVQVHPRGVRHISADGSINEWPAPQHRTIVAACTNERQVAIALSSGEIAYFELDMDGSLSEFQERREVSGTVTCLSMGDVPEGRLRSSFLAVGCDDATVRVLSLDPDSTLESKSVQALSSAPHSLNIMPMIDSSSGGPLLFLHIGLYSGVYIRTVIDEITGDLSDTRTRFLGSKPVKLSPVIVSGQLCILALSSRPWLGYPDPHTKAFMLTPLNFFPLEGASNFASKLCNECIVGMQGQNMRIFTVEGLSKNLLQESIPLPYTPRDFVRHPDYPYFYIIEAESNVLSSAAKQHLINGSAGVNGNSSEMLPETFGHPRAVGKWASCIQVVDPLVQKKVIYTVDLEENEAAVSIAAVPFASQENEVFLVVGTGKDMVMAPRSHSGGFIHIYRFQDEGRSLEFIHKTKIEEPPLALLPFQARLLAGVGPLLRIYDLGMRQLLRKTQAQVVSRLITSLQTQGSRIIVSDVSESVAYVVYKWQTNQLIAFADDAIPRWTTCTTMVDYETVAGGDKFGNIFVLRCTNQISEKADEDGPGTHLVNERSYLGGASSRLQLMTHFWPQDIPTSLTKCQLVAGGRDVILWSGLQGTIGILVPCTSKDDVEFLQTLENHIRHEDPPLTGRDHLLYRGYYVPVKGVIDGDLCERFGVLPAEKKVQIAGEMDKTVREIERKIADMRSRVAY